MKKCKRQHVVVIIDILFPVLLIKRCLYSEKYGFIRAIFWIIVNCHKNLFYIFPWEMFFFCYICYHRCFVFPIKMLKIIIYLLLLLDFAKLAHKNRYTFLLVEWIIFIKANFLIKRVQNRHFNQWRAKSVHYQKFSLLECHFFLIWLISNFHSYLFICWLFSFVTDIHIYFCCRFSRLTQYISVQPAELRNAILNHVNRPCMKSLSQCYQRFFSTCYSCFASDY